MSLRLVMTMRTFCHCCILEGHHSLSRLKLQASSGSAKLKVKLLSIRIISRPRVYPEGWTSNVEWSLAYAGREGRYTSTSARQTRQSGSLLGRMTGPSGFARSIICQLSSQPRVNRSKNDPLNSGCQVLAAAYWGYVTVFTDFVIYSLIRSCQESFCQNGTRQILCHGSVGKILWVIGNWVYRSSCDSQKNSHLASTIP